MLRPWSRFPTPARVTRVANSSGKSRAWAACGPSVEEMPLPLKDGNQRHDKPVCWARVLPGVSSVGKEKSEHGMHWPDRNARRKEEPGVW